MELKSVFQALDMVDLSSAPLCGADKGTFALTITNPSGDHEYLDDFYGCEKKGAYMTNLDEVFQAPLRSYRRFQLFIASSFAKQAI
ncbi:MAG TPA: hypothetical protein VGK52_07145 [Polyangia bacterium]